MSTYTARRCSLHGQHNLAGKESSNVYSQAQHDDVPVRRADGVSWPFPRKPVSHRRPLSPGAEDSLDMYDFEKFSISKKSKGPLLKERHSDGIREIPGSHHPRKDSHSLPSGEVQMAREICEKELMLKEKLWRVEQKIRQKMQRDSLGVAPSDDQKGQKKHKRRQREREKAQTKTRVTEQHWREPVKNREDLMQKRKQEDVKQLRKQQTQRDEDRMMNSHEEERGRWNKKELEFAESPQSKMKGNKEAYDIAINRQKVSRELDKLRWQNVKKHTRKQGDGKDYCNWGEADVRQHDELEKPRELNKASKGNTGWTRGIKYRERKKMYASDNEQDMPQMSQHKTAYRLKAEIQRGAEGKIFTDSTLPPISSSFYLSTLQQGDLGQHITAPSSHLLPCRICKRKFACLRLEKHVHICKKVNQSHRQVFNSYANRTKGSAIEEFWKTHSISKTPEDLHEKNQRQNHKAYTKNLLQGRFPAATSK